MFMVFLSVSASTHFTEPGRDYQVSRQFFLAYLAWVEVW